MPRIVYATWPAGEISGGIKTAFQHVEILVEAGYEAALVSLDGVAPDWFETTARIGRLDEVRSDDVLVFPENNVLLLQAFASAPNPKIVFCQNPYLAHQGLGGQISYAAYGVTHIMCASYTVMQFCARRFPGLKLAYAPFYVDHSRFRFREDKKLQIAAVPRKRPTEFGAIVDLFRASYPEWRDLPWMYMHHATEAQVADGMMQSAVFLSLARLEAHGMTTLEAMACGCLVAGFRGVYGGTDTATARNGLWAAEDDVEGCVLRLADAVRLATARDATWRAMIDEGRRTAADYTRENTARWLLQFWRDALPELSPASR